MNASKPRLLLDAFVWGGAAENLRAAGYDVETVSSWGSDPGDDEILRRAFAAFRVVVTLDKDFGELIALHAASHWGVVRLVDIAARRQADVTLQVLQEFGEEVTRAIFTVEPGRVRIRTEQPE